MRIFLAEPAYGRKYTNPQQVLDAWYNGADFKSAVGYFSIRDLEYIRKSHDRIVIQWATGKEVVV